MEYKTMSEREEVFARELVALARKHHVHSVQGKFQIWEYPAYNGPDVDFHWRQGRLGAEDRIHLKFEQHADINELPLSSVDTTTKQI